MAATAPDNPPLERTAAAVYFVCGRASRVRRRGRSTAFRYPPWTMSYDLDFWRYSASVTLDHQMVYEQLSDGHRVEGLDDLPIDAVVRRVNEVFSDWQKLDDVTFD